MPKIPIQGKIVPDKELGNKVKWTPRKCSDCNLYYPSIKLKSGLCENCQPKIMTYKEKAIEGAIERKEKSIKSFQGKKEESIAWSSSIRDAVAWITQHPDWKKDMTDSERENWFKERQQWFYDFFTKEKVNEDIVYEPINKEAQIASEDVKEDLIPF